MKSLVKKMINKIIKKKIKISIAESCTGGLFCNLITSIPNSSKAFDLGLVTYSNKSKVNVLNVPKKIIKKYGSVSDLVCLSMVKNLYKINKSDICISITGIAGPKGGSKIKPVGLVYIGIKKGKKIITKKYLFKNKGRLYIQNLAVYKSVKLILSMLK